jgi:hypothetical protein
VPVTIPAEDVSRVRWWVAGLTFVAGLIIGVIVAAVLIGSTPEFGVDPTGSSSTDPSEDQQRVDGTVPVTAQARVNAACLRVINEAQDVYRILSEVDEAARDVDFQQLDDIVRRLQPVQARLERDLQECRVDTSVNTAPTKSPDSPVPTVPQPTTGSPR